MTTDLLRRRARLAAALAALAAALVTAALMASAGSAQAPAAPTTLHFTSTPKKGVGYGSFSRPHQGDRFGFGDTVSGDDTGYDRAVCTAIGRGLLCTFQVQLSKGTLTLQGIAPQVSKNTPIAVTGGTGAYDGARGTALVTDKQGHTDIVVNLLP